MTSVEKGYPVLLAVLAMATLAAFVFSLLVGPAAIGFADVLQGLLGEEAGTVALIAREIRLPRAILGLAIGASLGLSGAAMQGLLRNPLAEPGIIGVSGAAALGAVIAIYSGFALAFPLALPVLAIAGSLTAVLILQWLAAGSSVLVLILAGIAISSLAGALTSLALNLSPNPFAALEIVFWMLGAITDRSMDHVMLSLPFMAAGWGLLLVSSGQLAALSLGEDTALSLGVNLPRTRFLVITGTALCVGAATAVSGVIGFVGLVVPHILRPFVGHHAGRLLPASALGGALLLLSADVLIRVMAAGPELKLGVVTALLGAPFFLLLILKARRGKL